MSAGVLLVTAKLTRHNKAGAYQTLTVQFKLIPADAKLPLDKLLITEAWAKENHLLAQGSAKPATSGEKVRSYGSEHVNCTTLWPHVHALRGGSGSSDVRRHAAFALKSSSSLSHSWVRPR